MPKFILPFLLLLILTGCVTTAATPTTFDRRAMLTDIVETTILPGHEAFISETEQLAQQAEQFQAEPTADNLAAVQAQWRATADQWAQIEPFGFRFTMVVRGQIKKWPINTRFIEKFIVEQETIDEPFLDSIGSTSKGLTAIEYLLFGSLEAPADPLTMLTNQPQRMAYLVAASQNLHRKAEELYALWSAEGENQAQAFIEADFSGNELQGSISMLTNELIELSEKIANDKLNYPRKGVYGEPQPETVESPYGNHSLPLAIANLRGLHQIYQTGFDDYLDFLALSSPDDPLSQKIDAQFTTAITALEAIDQPLAEAVLDQPETVEAAYNEVKNLLVLIKVDMANQLGVTVTFSDNDGD